MIYYIASDYLLGVRSDAVVGILVVGMVARGGGQIVRYQILEVGSGSDSDDDDSSR